MHHARLLPEPGFAPEFGCVVINSRASGFFKIGMFVQNFFLDHAGPEPAENVPDDDAQPANARLPTSFPVRS